MHQWWSNNFEIKEISLISFLEALRIFPPAGSLVREVTKDYQVPESKVVLKKSTTIIVSVYGIHHDSSIYENPESYDPDRFTPENISKRHQMSFIPFGNLKKKGFVEGNEV